MGEFKKRLVASFCIAPLIASVFYFLPDTWFSGVLTLIAIIALFELITMSGTGERYLLLILTLLCIIPLYFKLFFIYAVCLLFAPFVFLIYKIINGESKKPGINEEVMKGIYIIFLGEIFVVLPLYHLSLLKKAGFLLPFILLLTIWASDTCAYLFGKGFGKRKLVPMISPKKTYEKCPDCGSEDINTISAGDNPQRPVGQPGQGRRRGYGGSGIGAGPPSKCKCTQCGYETVKTPGVPCRTSNCPECGALMCGAD